MENARTKSKELAKRVEAMRRRMAKELGGKELSIKEEAWAAEVSALSSSLGEPATPSSNDLDASTASFVTDDLTSRLSAINTLQRSLIARANEAAEQQKALQPSTPTRPDNTEDQESSQDLSASINRVPADFRKQKIAQVMQLLQRESALVDAVQERLGKLAGLGNSYSSL